MKSLLLVGTVAFALALPGKLPGQSALLYQQTFPYGTTGSFPVSCVGWANDIPDNPNRLYQLSGSDGAVYAYEASAASTAFYTSTTISSQPGVAGMTFPTIYTTAYSNVSFSVDIAPSLSPANVSAYVAVQVSGNSWYVSRTKLPVPGTASSAFATYLWGYSPTAAGWNQLTVSGNGTGSGARIGSAAASDLAGPITGAGLVFVHSGAGGTFNFDNFVVTCSNVGSPTASITRNGQVTISWNGALNVCLQSNSVASSQGWVDLTGTAGQNGVTLALTGQQALFRLHTFVPGRLQDGDFESGNLSLSWQSTGTAGTAMLVNGGAFSGSYSLLQSNSAPYSVQTWQLVTNLPNGIYKLTAMIENGGGQTNCYLSANDRTTSLPILTPWTNIIVRGISVTNGQCLVSIVSADPVGGHWCRVDFLQLINDDLPYNFLKGGDISELTYVEQGGGTFYETNGVQTDCLQILKNHGYNIVRLRLYNDPGNQSWYPSRLLPAGIESPTNILQLAARAKAMGFQIELTFHLSDYWSSGGTQYKPHSWVGLSFAQLTNAVYIFTSNFMAQMQSQGTTPDYVSLGDEIQSGILFTDSSPTSSPIITTNSPVNGYYTNFAALAQLLNAGYAGVKTVSPATKVIIHDANIDPGDVNWFFSQCAANGVNWDVIGCSYYPFWTGLTAEQAEADMNQWYSSFNKPIMIMETGYNWATNLCNGSQGQLANNGPEPFPSTTVGQKEFLLNCYSALKLVNYGHCLGDLYWDPVFICVPGEGWELGQPNVVDNTTLFDFNGHALPSLDAFQFNN